MNVLITGVQNAIKDSAVKLAVGRIGAKARLRVLGFGDFLEEDVQGELQLLKSSQRKLMDSIQLKMLESGSKNIIINGYCTVRTRLGYYPFITKESLAVFKPDLMVFIETDPVSLPGKLGNPKVLMEHQAVEKQFSMLLAAEAGAGIRFIRSGRDGAREGADELYEVLKEALVVR